MSIDLRARLMVLPQIGRQARSAPVWLWVTAGYFLICVALFWPALADGSVPLPLNNSSAQGDPVWAMPGREAPVQGVNLLLGDVSGFYYPYLVFTTTRLNAGDLPLWNPSIFGGMPFFASNQAALLYPINLLTFWLGPHHYWTAAATLRLLLAGLGMFLLLGRFGVRPVAAFAAGAIYMLADFNIVWLLFAIHNITALIPLALWLIHRVLSAGEPQQFTGQSARRSSRSWCSGELLALALVVATQMFGGHPEMSLFFLVMCGLFALAFAPGAGASWQSWRHLATPIQALLPVGAAIVLGLLLSAVQWVPTLSTLRASYTYEERSFAAAQAGGPAFAPLGGLRQAGWENVRSWLLLVQPQLWGTPRGDSIRNWGPPATNYNEMTPFVGLAALAFALLGALRGRQRRVARFFGALLVGSLVLLYPLPGLNLLGYLPLIDVAHGFRFGAGVALAAAVLAGLGIDRLADLGQLQAACPEWAVMRRRRSCAWEARPVQLRGAGELAALGALCIGLAIVSVGATLLVVSPLAGPLLGIAPGQDARAQIAAVYSLANWRLAVPATAALAAALLAWLLRKRPSLEHGRIAAGLAALLVAGELLVYGIGYNGFTAPADIYPATATTRLLQAHADEGRVLPLDNALWANSAMTQGLEVTSGMDDLLPGEQMRFLKRGMAGIATARGQHVVQDWGRRLLDLMSVRHVVSTQPVVEGRQAHELALEQADGALHIYRNDTALPRAYLAFSTVAATRQTAEDLVYGHGFDPHRAVVVEGLIGDWPRADRPIEPATINVREPDRVEIVAELDAPAVLVLTDAYDAGWRVSVDGKAAPLLRANAMFRGVALTAGNHRVRFSYRPAPVAWGAAISLLGLVVLLVAALGLARAAVPVRAQLRRPSRA